MNYPQAAVPQAGYHPQPQPMPKRPALLVVFLLTTALAALAEIAAAVIVYTGGKELAESNMVATLEQYPEDLGLSEGMTAQDVKELSGDIWTDLLSAHADALAVRAGMAIFFGAWLLICVAFSVYAARTARAFITAGAIIGLLPSMLFLADYTPDSVFILCMLSMLLSLVAVVLCWLPPNNRFARARRAAKG